jgi:SPP1 family phage portal protein
MQTIGRRKIYTDVKEITKDNVVDVLRRAFPDHLFNTKRIDFLLKYDAGDQPLMRKKTYRSDIDCQCVDNVAHEITKFHTSFKWGNPITFVQRGERDSGGNTEPLAVNYLNECYEAEEIRKKTQELGRYVEICGIGYSYVDVNTEYEPGDSPFNVDILSPMCTFVVYSSYYIGKRPMLGVTYRRDDKGNKYFTCFSKDAVYEVLNMQHIINGDVDPEKETWMHTQRSGEANLLGRIPIIEWFRSYDRMGCFEREISEMDNLNILVSDFTNDVEQNTQAIWHSNDVEFPTEIVKNADGTETSTVRKPKTNEWMQTFTTQDGKTPFVEALAVNYDYSGMLNNIITRRALILQKCNVPQRNDNSGGSTGIAMDAATGWDAAEIEANMQQNIMEGSKMEELKVVLRAIAISPFIEQDNPMLTLRYMDVQPSIKRQKNFELTNKINFFATAVSHGIYGLHALKAMNAFEDVNQVWEDSRNLIAAYQKSIFEKSTTADAEQEPDSDRLSPDNSDQTENSPNLRG